MKWATMSCFIGDGLPSRSFVDNREQLGFKNYKFVFICLGNTLLIKRSAIHHEKEVRFYNRAVDEKFNFFF